MAKKLNWTSHPDGDVFSNGREVPYRISYEGTGFRVFVSGEPVEPIAPSQAAAREWCQLKEAGLIDTQSTPAAAAPRARSNVEEMARNRALRQADVVTLMIPLEQLREDPENVRKVYDLASLDALGESLKVQQLQPIGVRPTRAGGQVVPNDYTVKWGHRRLRAAIRTKTIRELRCEVLDATDDQVPAQQLTENDQRDPLKALERSNAHQQMKARGLSAEQIAAATSTSPATVRDSLKLQELSPALKKAWTEGKLDSKLGEGDGYSRALEFAKVSAKVQGDALKRYVEITDEQKGDPCTVRQLRHMLRSEFMLELAKAPFPIADAQLVPAAGACTTCTKRTCAPVQKEFFPATAKDEPDLCLDKPCHDAKGDAMLARAEKEGRAVLAPTEAEKVFSEYGNNDRPMGHSGFVEPNEKRWTGSGYAKKTNKQLVDPKDVVLAKNPHTGKIVELVRESALPKANPSAGQGTRGNPHVKTPAEKRKDRELVITKKTITRILDSMAQLPEIRERGDEFAHLMILGQLQAAQQEFKKQVAKRLGLEFEHGHEAEDVLKKHIQTLTGPALSRVAVFVACCEFSTVGEYNRDTPELLLKAAKLFDLNVPQLRKLATAELDTELKEKADKKEGNYPKRTKGAKGGPGEISWGPEFEGEIYGRAVADKTDYAVKKGKGGWMAGRANTTGALIEGIGPFNSSHKAQAWCTTNQMFAEKKKGKAA